MLRKCLESLTSPAVVLACGLGAVVYVALHPPREATPHERFLRDMDPDRPAGDNFARGRSHRLACPSCGEIEARVILCQVHPGAEYPRILAGLAGRAERAVDHVRGCPPCRARPVR